MVNCEYRRCLYPLFKSLSLRRIITLLVKLSMTSVLISVTYITEPVEGQTLLSQDTGSVFKV